MSDNVFFDEGREIGSKCHLKRAIIGPLAKCHLMKQHLNGISLAGRYGPTLNADLVAL